MTSGTDSAPVPEHSPALVDHYYEEGGGQMSRGEAYEYARSEEAFDGAMCLTCQRQQGGQMSGIGKFWVRFWGY
jgi:hypothetical protein